MQTLHWYANLRSHLARYCAVLALTVGPAAAVPCGELITVETQQHTETRYSWRPPASPSGTTLLLLVGGNGHLNLDQQGCPHALQGNSLVRALPYFHQAGLGTALLDARSDHQGSDGLAGLRNTPQHAADLALIMNDLRQRGSGPIWLIGTSRGSISAANAAARISGTAAAAGVVLTSALLAGDANARKDWVAQSVFDVPLDHIRQPVLIIGHADDSCPRSPPARMPDLAAQLRNTSPQLLTLRGSTAGKPAQACTGQSPHGYWGVEKEMADAIVKFVTDAR